MAPKFAPWEPSWLQDPWPQYRELREAEPVYWSQELGHWILTRYEDVVQVLRDPRFTATNRPPQRRWGRPTMMVTADPPEHSRLRRPVAHQFGSAAVDALRPMMQSIVDELLDAAEARGEMDIAWDYARVLPRRIITHMMGVPYVPPERPTGNQDAFGQPSREAPAPATDGHDAPPAMAAAPQRLAPPGMAADPAQRMRRQPPTTTEDVETPQDRWFKNAIEQHRAEVRDDVLQTLLEAESGGKMTDEEVLDTATILYGAGQETTGSLISNAMYQLLQRPDQLQRLAREPELIRSAVDELLRLDAPVHSMRRKALEDVEMGGKTVRAGDKALVMLMAANHDPDVFANPENMDLGRKDNYHIAFGSGVHTCLGGILARAEAQVAIGSLVRRFPNMRLAQDEVRYQGSFVLRSIRELRVEVA
jgi:cytochrome P450